MDETGLQDTKRGVVNHVRLRLQSFDADASEWYRCLGRASDEVMDKSGANILIWRGDSSGSAAW